MRLSIMIKAIYLFFFININEIDCVAQENSADSKQVHSWYEHIGGFRNNHNFAFTLGTSQGVWEVGNFGEIDNETFPTKQLCMKAQYSYHLQSTDHLGWLLGSSLGSQYNKKSQLGSGFDSSYSIQFPGFLVGGVYNLSSLFRFSIAVDIYLERVEELKKRNAEKEQTITITLMNYTDLMLLLDFFYTLNWGVRVETHMRWAKYTPPKGADGSIIGASIKREDIWLGVGVVYHLL